MSLFHWNTLYPQAVDNFLCYRRPTVEPSIFPTFDHAVPLSLCFSVRAGMEHLVSSTDRTRGM